MFLWDDFEKGTLVIPEQSSDEKLKDIEYKNVKLTRELIEEINNNMFYTCSNTDCSKLKGTKGKFTGKSTAKQKVNTSNVKECGAERNFFGGIPRKFPGYTGYLPTL